MYPVLIVDDEPAIADLIEMTLETLGYRVRQGGRRRGCRRPAGAAAV